MNCCTTQQGTNKFFSRFSKRYGKQFRKKGLLKEQRLLIEGIAQASVTGKSILDIGCGVGSLHFELLKKGASKSMGVDMAEGMLDQAKTFSRDLGLEEKTEYRIGDFALLNGSVPAADITMLDKVVCCYQNVDLLVERSTEKTNEAYGLTFPHDIFPIRAFFKIQIFVGKLLRWSFHPWWHDWNQMCRRIESRGFRESYRNNTFVWTIRVYRRENKVS